MQEDMPGVIGISVFVLVSTLGLVHLAVHRPRAEHLVGVGVVASLAALFWLAVPAASVLLLAACVGTRRLAMGTPAVTVPDRIPTHWG